MHAVRIALFALLSAAALSAQVPANPATTKPSKPVFLSGEQRQAFLQRIEKRMTGVQTIAAEFEQEKVLALFDESAFTPRLIIFRRPDKLRWETQRPFRSLLIVNADDVAKFEYTSGDRRPLKLGRARDVLLIVMKQIRGWFRGNFGQDAEDYDIAVAESPRPMIVLKPKDAAMRKNLRAIEVELKADLRSVERVTIREPGDDKTVMTFRELRRDAALPPSYFDPTNPDAVTTDAIRKLPGHKKPKQPVVNERDDG